jgi:hypothetical protein
MKQVRTGSSASSLIMAGPRFYACMTEDRYFPTCLAARNGARLANDLRGVVSM